MTRSTLILPAALMCAAAAFAAKPVIVAPLGPAPKATAAAPAPVAVRLPVLTEQQIVDRNAAARGGLAAWKQVQAMSLIGKLDAGKTRRDGGQIALAARLPKAQVKAQWRQHLASGAAGDGEKTIQLPFQMDLQRPVKSRLEIPFQGETAVQVYDGVNGWKLRPYLGRHEVEPFTEAELAMAASQQELDGPLIGHQAKGITVTLDGNELVEGRGAYKLKLSLKNGEVRHVWIDAQTFLDLKIDGAPRRWDGRMRNVVTYFRDYKPVNGLMIPHRLETAMEGVPGSENIFVEKVALNPALGDSRFARPQ